MRIIQEKGELKRDKERRERISEAVGLIHQAREILEEVLDEEQKSYESLPEGMQNGEKGEQMQENMEIIEDVLGCLEDVDDLEDIS